MKVLNSIKLNQIVIVLLSFTLITLSYSCKKAAEKRTEKAIEKAIGDDANVDIGKDKVVIETEGGKFTSEEVKHWPKDIPNDVPEFEYGKILNASTQEFDGGKSWTVMYENVPDDAMDKYKDDLKNDGFKIESTIKMGKGGHLNATKGERIVIIMAGEGMATISVTQDR